MANATTTEAAGKAHVGSNGSRYTFHDNTALCLDKTSGIAESMRLKINLPVGTQIEISGIQSVVLDYYKDKTGYDKVLLGTPGETDKISALDLTALKRATTISSLDPDACDKLLKTQEARNLVVAFTHTLRLERLEDPSAQRIPFLRDNPQLRYDLFKEVASTLVPKLMQGGVEDSTVLDLVRAFFDARLAPSKKPSSEAPGENKHLQHLHFGDAPTKSGRIEFEDKLAPVTVEGLDGHPVQVVTREFITNELEKVKPPSDMTPITQAEVKLWLQKHLEPYPMKVLLHGERANTRGACYLRSDVFIALRDNPLRKPVPRLNEMGRAEIAVNGAPTEVVTAGALSAHRLVNTYFVRTLLVRLSVAALPDTQLREHNSERQHNVYPARAAEPIISLLSSNDGVAIPVGNSDSPFRVAMTLSAFATRLGRVNEYACRLKLATAKVSPITLTDTNVSVTDRGKLLGKAHPTVYEVPVPHTDQHRLLLADDKGTLLAFGRDGIKDVDTLYWLEDLEKTLEHPG